MAETFTRFDPAQDVVSNLRQTVSSGMWSGGTGTLTTFFTSSTQSSSKLFNPWKSGVSIDQRFWEYHAGSNRKGD